MKLPNEFVAFINGARVFKFTKTSSNSYSKYVWNKEWVFDDDVDERTARHYYETLQTYITKFDWQDIPLAEWADGYEGPWVLTTSHEGWAGYGVNYGPKKTALYFESHEALCEYWDKVKHLPKGVKCQVDSFPLRIVR